MKIVAIGALPFDLELTCLGALNRAIIDGHKVHILVAYDPIWTNTKADALRREFLSLGASTVYFTDRFDYSSVTQKNADLIGSFIKSVDPSMVIIPFWKSHNRRRRIVANTSLVACRGIGTILMYEVEKNAVFVPNIYFPLCSNDVHIKRSYFMKYGYLADSLKALSRKTNCHRMNLSTKTKSHLPLFYKSHTSMEVNTVTEGKPLTITNSQGHDLVFEGYDLNPEINLFGETSTADGGKQGNSSKNSRESQSHLLVEEFECHRLLLIDNSSEVSEKDSILESDLNARK